ncbi:type IV leader peptidase [Lachnospiraceae bacterium JC7]|nr:type IV leader peptidase [Lachnospiraceae bacterium JC7]
MYISFSITYFYLLIFLSYFFLSSIYDIKTRKVPCILHLIFILLGFPVFIYFNLQTKAGFTPESILSPLIRFIPGIILSLISIASKGGLGIGDAVFITVSAFFIPVNYILLLVISGFITASMAGIFILVYGKLTGKHLYTVSLPFIPFMLPGLYFILRDMEYTGGLI